MTNRYAWVFATLGFVLAVLAIIVTVLGLKVTSLQDDIRHRDQAENIAKVTQCRDSIRGVTIANRVVDYMRAEYRQRANQLRSLAAADPTDRLRRAHLRIAAQLHVQAASLTDFPAVTPQQCDRLARRLGVK